MRTLFFELLQVSIGARENLSRTPIEEEWHWLFATSQKQALTGVCFNGIQRLIKSSPSQVSHLPSSLKIKWLGIAANIQKRNEHMNARCIELQKILNDAGFKSSIIKGQSMAILYADGNTEENDKASGYADSLPLHMLRQPGDIDVFVDAALKEVLCYAKMHGDENPDWDYKHLHLRVFSDTKVEIHYVPEVFLNIIKNWRLQKWFKSNKGEMFVSTIKLPNFDNVVTTPTIKFNLFYILLHIYRHFLYEGIGLRQFIDYYFVLKANTTSPDLLGNSQKMTQPENNRKSTNTEFECIIRKLGMHHFVQGVMWIMKEIFLLDDASVLCKPNEKEGRYIIEQVMQGGNFGYYDQRLNVVSRGKLSAVMKVLKHNLHLLMHYPADVFWAPIWVLYHWCWKRLKQHIMK